MKHIFDIEDVKQLVLFKILDYQIEDWMRFVAIDKNGGIGFYKARPKIDNVDEGWTPSSRTRAKIFNDRFDIPEGVDWHDLCFWL